MSGLLDAVRDELRNREQRREQLVAELAAVDRDLEQLTQISELAESLNGNGAVETPEPVEPSRGRAEDAGDPAPVSGNGGNAPARHLSRAGSAPSGAPKRAPSSTAGSKRAAVLAYIQEHGEVQGAAAIATAVGISVGAIYQHLMGLIESGQVEAKGPRSARVYFCPAASGSADTPPPAGGGANGHHSRADHGRHRGPHADRFRDAREGDRLPGHQGGHRRQRARGLDDPARARAGRPGGSVRRRRRPAHLEGC